MDFDILIWILIAALPIISGLMEKKRAKQRRGDAEAQAEFPHPDAVDGAHASETHMTAAEVIERILSGDPAPASKPARKRDVEFKNPIPEPHWESGRDKPAPGMQKKRRTDTSILSKAPEVESTASNEPAPFVMPSGEELSRAFVVSEVLGLPRARRPHRDSHRH